MTLQKLTADYLDAFKEYCQVHRYEHDESYLYEEDMEEFELNSGKHPTWILIEAGNIIGVLSLMLDEYFFKAGKSRIRIFHCATGRADHYKTLLDALVDLPENITLLEMFLPDKAVKSQEIIKGLDFQYYRTSYVMSRVDKKPEPVILPSGYSLRGFVSGEDENHYANIRNTAFKHLKGSETPLTEEQVLKLTSGGELLDNGIQLMCYKDIPVGLVRMELEDGPDGRFGFVAPIALLPEHQGKGLGTQLLRAGIAVSNANGLPDTMLSVNAENEQALGLYTKSGFTVDESVTCFHRKTDR